MTPTEPGPPDTEPIPIPPPEPPLAFTPDGGDFTEEHAQVFSALAAAQEANLGEAVTLEQLAGGGGLPRDRLPGLLHDLTVAFRLVSELTPDGEDGGDPRFEIRPRL